MKQLILAAIFTSCFAINPSEIFSINESNAKFRLDFLEKQFTRSGWLKYTKAMNDSGILPLIKKGQLSIKAEDIGEDSIIVTYDFPTYTYKQKIFLRLEYLSGKINEFEIKLLKQTKIIEKNPKCMLNSKQKL